MQNNQLMGAIIKWRSSRFGFVGLAIVLLLFCWLCLRLALLLCFRPAASLCTTSDLLKTFLLGFHLDLAVALCVSLPVLMWFCLLSNRHFASQKHRKFILGASFIFWSVQIFMLFSEFFFFDEFKSRFNTVAIDYLIYPTEVFVNIWDTYPVVWILTAALLSGFLLTYLLHKLCSRMWESPETTGSKLAHLGLAGVLTGSLIYTASLEEHHFSKQRVLNEISNNGIISFIAAAWSRNLDYSAFYRTIPKAEARQRARELLQEPGSQFVGDSIQRHIAGDTNRPRLNVVILLEESLGSEFWGSLGRKEATLTPCLDTLASEGMFFDNIYATGNRTVRGFEGVLASFPPLPGDSIVKRDRSENVETIARVLKRDGYQTMFLYGGRGLFDGMRSFATHNGYERFVEQKDFAQPTFTTIWGVCNEDLYQRTIVEMRELNAKRQPFFATVLSVSNHKPYTYPEGRIQEDPKQRRRENAVKYTDWALGQFFASAKKEAFWTNTLFVVVADHGARVYGSQTIPIHSYEIPLLLLGPAIIKSSSRQTQLGCQMDIAPTILGLLGRPYDSMFFGRDLMKPSVTNGFALFNHNRDIGLYKDNHLVILNLNQKSEFFHGDPKTDGLERADTPDAKDLRLLHDAIALFQTADELYMSRNYTLDPPAAIPRK